MKNKNFLAFLLRAQLASTHDKLQTQLLTPKYENPNS